MQGPSKLITITPIILCGGFGSRLWPLSREDLPKQFIKFNANLSLFQNTVKRMQEAHGRNFQFERPIVATSTEHRFLVADQLREIGVVCDVMLEPLRRDSAAAILAATNLCIDQKRKGLVMVVASDHVMSDVQAFYDHVEMALNAAFEHIVLFGIQPQMPSTDYGYISPGDELPDLAPVHRVAKFSEKPTREVAEIYIAKGYVWNSGNFICRPELLIVEAGLLAPEIAGPAGKAAKAARRGDDFIYLDQDSFTASKSLSIDFAVLEKTSKAAVLPSNFPWSDLGTWRSIHAVLEQDSDGNAAVGPVQFTHAQNNLVISQGAFVAVEGLSNVVVTVTADAILVASMDAGAAMKIVVEQVKKSKPALLKSAKP